MVEAESFFALIAIGAVAFDAFLAAYLALLLLIFVVADLAGVAGIAVDAFLAALNAGKAFLIAGVEVVLFHAGEAGGGILAAMAAGQGGVAGWT